jgi:ectoine hydroxylase-related dioxygenase (phytanoyl-CoA dioxygenase family)
MIPDQAQVIVGSGGAQCRGTASGLLAKDAIELGITAEPGFECGSQCGRTPPPAVETQKPLQSLLIAEPADRDAGLLLEYPAQMRRAQARSPRQRRKIACVRVVSQHACDRLHRRMEIDPFDVVVAVEERTPGEAQQVRQTGVDQNVVHGLRLLNVGEEGAETTNPAGVETARELPDGVLFEQGAGLPGRRDPSDEGWPEHRPPELVVGRLVDQQVILTGKEPGQRAGRERIAPLAQQVGGGPTDHEVDLELGMAVRAGSNVADPVPDHAPVEGSPDSEVVDHRKKREKVADPREDSAVITADYVIIDDHRRVTMTVFALHVTSEHAHQLQDQGFFVLERALPPRDLNALRDECQRFIDERDREMDRLGVDKLDLDRRGIRYFVHAWGKSAAIERFLSSDLMVQIAQAALGETVYLFNEQYVVKAAEQGMPFSWHQDSGFIDYPHRPYLTCWIALDDMTEANGTVCLLPYARAGTRDVVKHARDEESNDLVGYFGNDPGDPVIVPAGSIVCFSSMLFHRSGANTTDRMRRVYVAQYSAEPILSEDGSQPRSLAEPLLVDGERVEKPRSP